MSRVKIKVILVGLSMLFGDNKISCGFMLPALVNKKRQVNKRVVNMLEMLGNQIKIILWDFNYVLYFREFWFFFESAGKNFSLFCCNSLSVWLEVRGKIQPPTLDYLSTPFGITVINQRHWLITSCLSFWKRWLMIWLLGIGILFINNFFEVWISNLIVLIH